MEREKRLLNPREVLAIASNNQITLVEPCGQCDQTPDKCMTDGERALSYDPIEKAAQCLKTREIIILGGGLGLDSDIIRKEKK